MPQGDFLADKSAILLRKLGERYGLVGEKYSEANVFMEARRQLGLDEVDQGRRDYATFESEQRQTLPYYVRAELDRFPDL